MKTVCPLVLSWERNLLNALARRVSPPMVWLPQEGQGFR